MKNHGGTRAALLTFSLTLCYTGGKEKNNDTVEKRRVQAVQYASHQKKIEKLHMAAPDQFIQLYLQNKTKDANGKPQ